jgi:hypothetical protein
MSLDVNDVLQGINHLSPIKYAIANLAPYSLTGQVFTCEDSQRLVGGGCPIDSGVQVLRLYNLDKDGPMNVMALGVCTIVYRAVAYAFLKGVRSRGVWGWWRKLWARRRPG